MSVILSSPVDHQRWLRRDGLAATTDPTRSVWVQAAIALALQAALPALVREITEKGLVALGH